MLAVAAVAGTLALTAGPAAYSAANLGHALNGNNVTAGPSGGGMGGMGGGSVSDDLVAYLEANRDGAKYLVAATGSQTSAPIIVATGEPVVTIGGFGGRDPAPTVAQLEQLVADGELKYVLLGGGRGPGGGDSDVSAWVQAHGTPVTGVETGGATLYEVAA